MLERGGGGEEGWVTGVREGACLHHGMGEGSGGGRLWHVSGCCLCPVAVVGVVMLCLMWLSFRLRAVDVAKSILWL